MNLKKLLFAFAILGIALTGFSSCSSDDDDNTPTENELMGNWKISKVQANVKTNNEKATAAIKSSIEKFQFLQMLQLAVLNFDDKENFQLTLDITEGQDPTWVAAIAKGKYKSSPQDLSIQKFESIDLGGLKELIPLVMPELDPAMLENLPALANTFVPFDMKLKEVVKDSHFTGIVPLTDIYKDPAKIKEILDAAGITDVDPATVTIENVEVEAKCVAIK